MNEQAKILAKIAGKVTLTPITVELAKQLGIKFEVIQNPVTLWEALYVS